MTEKKILSYDDIRVFESEYLAGGFKNDDIRIDAIEIDGDSLKASCSMVSHYIPPDGGFHLSVPIAFMAVAQIVIAWSHIENGLTKKESEVWLTRFDLRCAKPVTSTTGISIRIARTAKRAMNGGVFYLGNVDIADGSFKGKASFFLPLIAGVAAL
ncbi:hypothetical protein ASD42_01725 [Nocardia sp. Root136]|uniref:hypothetical protein n=1 Tax=Nocardia sp. Root136 TaxID=1736458 RepID=UPI0006F6B4BE|nr:hypothetical protein [Nocardia sp. Root136]KQY37351.1 hypothetical protein ASD42_01725 [Nocardia sp. Root136]